jgi:ABC-type microcin C transport system duplicated ATPase subunit YejF
MIADPERPGADAVLIVEDVSKTFRVGRPSREIHAVAEVTLSIGRGVACAVVGESGSGKSTLGRLVTGLLQPDSGEIRIDGVDIASLDRKALRAMRRRVTVVFQEPFESLNPALTVARNIEEPLRIHRPDLSKGERMDLVGSAIVSAGLDTRLAKRHPASLSGGQQQRVGIARAIVTEPTLMVLDEPTASLDVSVRAQIWELVARLREESGLSMMVITHDFETVEALCGEVVVMQFGRVVESGRTDEVVSRPAENYTRTLVEARMLPPALPRHYLEQVSQSPASASVPA